MLAGARLAPGLEAAPGSKRLLRRERRAAEEALASGGDCRCFCGHTLSEHRGRGARRRACGKERCACKCFEFVPSQPEEVGEHWLPRRASFVAKKWRAKCRCGHSTAAHARGRRAATRSCASKGCGCMLFRSAYLCLICDGKQDEHVTVFETEQERKAAGRPVGQAFMPLHELPDVARAVFGDDGADEDEERRTFEARLLEIHAAAHKDEDSVLAELANKYGKRG